MKGYFRLSYFGLLIVLIITSCSQMGSGASAISIEEAWARPGSQGGNSAIYFIISNSGQEDDVLLGVRSDAAAHVEMHMSRVEDGVMKMEPQETIPIPMGEQVIFEPGGLHVMLIDLAVDLNPNDRFPLTLQFEESGEIAVEITVRQP